MFTQAIAHLSASDPVLRNIIRGYGQCTFMPRIEGTHFAYLVRVIISQQLSIKAANTIHARFLDLCNGCEPTPENVIELSEDYIRSAGVSKQKLTYIKDLAIKSYNGMLPIGDLDGFTDDELIKLLIQVKGIGRWSAKMFLMFKLGRENVLPEDDLSIQKAIMLAYGLEQLPTPKHVQKIGAPWSPYSSIAAWYLYRTLD